MGYAKHYLNYENIDIFGAQEATKAIQSDRRVFSTSQCLENKETSNGYLVVSTEIESDNYNQHAINIVIESVVNFFEDTKHDNIPEAMKSAVLQANRQLFFFASHNENLKGITMSILVTLVRDKQLFYAYVGNTNLFHASEGKVKRLTPGVSQVEGDEMEEIPLLNSSKIDPDLAINVCDRPVVPDNDDYFLVCPKAYVYTSDEIVEQVLEKNNGLDKMGEIMLQTALSQRNTLPKTFSITHMNLIGGKANETDDISAMYGGFLSKIVSFMTSPFALLGMAIFIIILLSILYGLM